MANLAHGLTLVTTDLELDIDGQTPEDEVPSKYKPKAIRPTNEYANTVLQFTVAH
jgi:hypothetical protein